MNELQPEQILASDEYENQIIESINQMKEELNLSIGELSSEDLNHLNELIDKLKVELLTPSDNILSDDEENELSDFIDFLKAVELFKKKPTFDFARRIWFLCYKQGYHLPEIVIKKFADGIRKQIEENTTKDKGEKLTSDIKFLLEVNKLKAQRSSLTEIFDMIADKEDKTVAAVKQKYWRLKLKYQS